MKVYVAGSTKDRERVREVMDVIQEAGHTLTFNWLGPEGEIRASWKEDPERAREIAQSEIQGVRDAEVVVLVLHDKILGAAIETGAAMMSETPVIVFGNHRESVFWYLPNVIQIEDSLKQLVELLGRMESMMAGDYV